MQLSLLTLRNPGKQKMFLAVALAFILFLAVAVIYRSATRRSVLNMASKAGMSDVDAALGLLGGGAGLQLKDFHRVQVKGGNAIWEITARSANYLSQQKVTQISDPKVTVHRPKQPPVVITSRAAKLYMSGEDLERAELEGEVMVNSNSGVTLRTENATYEVETRLIRSPVEVQIFGHGFMIKGNGLEMPIDTEVVSLLRDVDTRVDADAAGPPTGLMDPQKKGK